MLLWLRGLDLNQRPPGYELLSVFPSAATQSFPDIFEPKIALNPKVVPLDLTVWEGIGMDYLGITVNLQKRIHHRRYTSLTGILCVSIGSIPYAWEK